jgi:hypothetical protein
MRPNLVIVDEWPPVSSCRNPSCEALVTSAAYCCGPCANAAEGGYEIHEAGLLAHTDFCRTRQALRTGAR